MATRVAPAVTLPANAFARQTGPTLAADADKPSGKRKATRQDAPKVKARTKAPQVEDERAEPASERKNPRIVEERGEQHYSGPKPTKRLMRGGRPV